MKKKKQHIDLGDERYGLFMSERSFNLDVMYGRGYLENDIRHTVKVYRINIIKTKSHSLYGQAKPSDRAYFPPVKISIMPNIDDSEQKYYGDSQGGITRDDVGNITFGVYLDELKEKNVEISRGDIIEYNMSGEKNRYFEVEFANNVTDSTNLTIGGFKPYWKKITAVPVKEDVVKFLSETKGQ